MPNILSTKLFRLVFCLFRFNRNVKARCFGIEFETTETNCFDTNRNKPKQPETSQNFMKNTKICSLSNCFGWSSVCLGSIVSVSVSGFRMILFRKYTGAFLVQRFGTFLHLQFTDKSTLSLLSPFVVNYEPIKLRGISILYYTFDKRGPGGGVQCRVWPYIAIII